MDGPRYTVEYDTRLGCYRWQIAPGERLQAPSRPSGGRTLRVVALGGGTGLPILLKGLKAALFPPGRASAPAGDRNHAVLLNAAPLPGELLERYAADGAVPVPAEAEPLRALGYRWP